MPLLITFTLDATMTRLPSHIYDIYATPEAISYFGERHDTLFAPPPALLPPICCCFAAALRDEMSCNMRRFATLHMMLLVTC